MSRKIKIAFIFILMITLSTGYFLWQIDKHEKALIGQEWLNPVPYTVWLDYKYKKYSYERLVEKYKHNNPELMQTISQYQKKDKKLVDDVFNPFEPTLNEIFDQLPTPYTFVPTPPDFYLNTSASTALSKENPEQYKNYSTILKDINDRKYTVPTPSNPPNYVIRQSIRSLYRSMATIEAILLLAFITFMVLYKEINSTKLEGTE